MVAGREDPVLPLTREAAGLPVTTGRVGQSVPGTIPEVDGMRHLRHVSAAELEIVSRRELEKAIGDDVPRLGHAVVRPDLAHHEAFLVRDRTLEDVARFALHHDPSAVLVYREGAILRIDLELARVLRGDEPAREDAGEEW